MTMLDSALINRIYARANALKQAPDSWYENPVLAYIPLIGTVASIYAQFSLHDKLDELKEVLDDIRMVPSAFYIHRTARQHVRDWDLLGLNLLQGANRDRVYENWNREIADLQQKVNALQREKPQIVAKSLQLIDVSNHQATVSIIQSAFLYAIVISNIALGILSPAIGVPLLLGGSIALIVNVFCLAENYLEKISEFKSFARI